MIPPQDCQTIEDVRGAIDTLDREIIAKLGQRFEYVKAAAPFKDSAKAVQAQARFDSMLCQRRTWAEAEGLDADVIEKMYRDLVIYFIEAELKHWTSESS